MELVLRNPFRILGLPVTASSREIAKRISDLELFAELGKSKSYPFDLSELGAVFVKIVVPFFKRRLPEICCPQIAVFPD